MGRCKKADCKYFSRDPNVGGVCIYATCNGETRIGAISRRYGLQYEDPANKKFFDAENCPLFTKGERERVRPIILESFDDLLINKRPKESRAKVGSRLSEYEEHRRRELYDMGLNDKEAASILGITDSSFREWRIRRELPTKYKPK